MGDCLLYWALPDTWTQFELLAPDLDERIELEMRQRFQDAEVEPADLDQVIMLQREALHDLAGNGIILLATYAQQAADAEAPPPGLSLTLALGNRPASGDPSDGPPEPDAQQLNRSLGGRATRSKPAPFVLEDSSLLGFTQESREEVSVPGVAKRLSQFQTQAFVLPKDQLGMAVITVTTFDPTREDDARRIAQGFANTLIFLPADTSEA